MSKNYVTIHVLPRTKERLMKKGTTADTHDSVMVKVLDFHDEYGPHEEQIKAIIGE